MEKNQHDRMLARLIEKHGTPSWEKWGYRFLFSERKYYWKGNPITIGGKTAVALYQRLVLGWCNSATENPQAIGYLRSKYGRGFLEEVIDPRKSHRRKGEPRGWLWY